MRLKPSRHLLALLVAGHAMAAAGLAAAPLENGLRLALLGLVLVSLVHAAARDALLALPWSVVQVDLLDDCGLRLVRRSGALSRHRLSRATAAWPGLTVIGVRGVRGWWVGVALLPDSTDAESLRRLRVALRWNCGGRD